MNFDEVYDIGNEETERFFNNVEEKRNEHKLQIVWKKIKPHVIAVLKKLLRILLQAYQSKLNNVVKVLCHRSPNRFWSVLFRQSVNFATVNTTIIWVGEPGQDGGGLYREFRCMRWFIERV